MGSEAQCVLPASLSSLPAATAFVEDFGANRGLAPEEVLGLRLVVEELFTNTATHGAQGGGVQVRLKLAATATEVELVYEDSAPPFDPLAVVGDAQAGLDAALAEHRVGGLGLVLVTRMAERVDYAREGQWNRLAVGLARQP